MKTKEGSGNRDVQANEKDRQHVHSLILDNRVSELFLMAYSKAMLKGGRMWNVIQAEEGGLGSWWL